jgi:hypothetical protein
LFRWFRVRVLSTRKPASPKPNLKVLGVAVEDRQQIRRSRAVESSRESLE